MRKAKQLIGLPVVDLASGKRVALVRSVLIDPERGSLIALVLQKSGLLWEGKAIPLSRVHAIGEDAVILSESAEPVSTASIMEEYPNALVEDKLLGRQVLTEDGRNLGTLADFCFDPESGKLINYVLSDGLLQNLIEGYSTIPAPHQAVVGDEHIIVSSPVQDEEMLTVSTETPQGR